MEYCYECYDFYKNIKRHNKTQKHQNQLKLKNIPNYVYENIYYYFDKYHLFEKGWEYNFVVNKSTLGLCDYDKKLISFSYYIFNDKNKFKDTLLHEIAHVLAGNICGHNKIWKKICIDIGGTGCVIADVDIQPKEFKYNITCEKGCCDSFDRLTKYRKRVKYCNKHLKRIKLIKNF